MSRVRYAGASGQLTVRADSGFYTHAVAAVCRRMDVRFSITIRQRQSLRNLTEAIPGEDRTPGSQLALFAARSYHGFITGRDGETLELEGNWRPAAAATPRPGTPFETSSTA